MQRVTFFRSGVGPGTAFLTSTMNGPDLGTCRPFTAGTFFFLRDKYEAIPELSFFFSQSSDIFYNDHSNQCVQNRLKEGIDRSQWKRRSLLEVRNDDGMDQMVTVQAVKIS